MKRIITGKVKIIMGLVLGFVFFNSLGLCAQKTERPNIIHIMVDDLGWRDLSVYGSESFNTPEIDALASRGMRFSNAYSASPLCSPTRASVLTGQTVGRIRLTSATGHLKQVILEPQEVKAGHPGFPMTTPETRTRLPLESVSIANVLKKQGYHTAFMGKWHLGHDPHIPENFGFDIVLSGRGTPGPPEGHYFGPWNKEANLPETEGNPNVDDILGDEAVKFIANHAGENFFLALWLHNVHGPWQGKPEVIEDYRSVVESARHQRSAIMGSMIKTLDDNVGKVMTELERQGLLENTIVIFTSDNGGNIHSRPEGVSPTHNYPLRAGKGNNYEGGTRIPLIVSWPGMIDFNTVSDALTISYDFFPTVLDILDIPAPEDWPLDGKSVLPALMQEPFDRGPIYTIFPHNILATGNIANVAMREGKYKLLRFFNSGTDQQDQYELYDLSKDVGETENLYPHIPDVSVRMTTTLAHHLGETGTLLPGINPDYVPNLVLGGFKMVKGGYLHNGDEQSVTIIAKDHRITLHYIVPEGTNPGGDVLEFEMVSNCAISVVAGPGTQPVFGKPVFVHPNNEKQKVKIPLGTQVSSGIVTVVFDLKQAGSIKLNKSLI